MAKDDDGKDGTPGKDEVREDEDHKEVEAPKEEETPKEPTNVIPIDGKRLTAEEELELEEERLFQACFEKDPGPRQALIQGLLPFDVWALVGAGGLSKSTFVVWLMVHIILNRPVFGRKIEQPGHCVYVTGEDEWEDVIRGLRRVCDALKLTEFEQHKVAKFFHIEDCTQSHRPLVEVGEYGKLQTTMLAGKIVGKYRWVKTSLIVFDPMSYFGPGEKYVNDGEAKMIWVARMIKKWLAPVSIGFVHHTGKAVYREGIVDQYAGRGGSAIGDHVRALLVMQSHDPKHLKETLPAGITVKDIAERRAMCLHVAKFTGALHAHVPLWLLRPEHQPWTFEHVKTAEQAHIEPQDGFDPKTAAEEAEDRADQLIVWNWVRDHQDEEAITRRKVRDRRAEMGLSQPRAQSAIAALLNGGYVVLVPIPEGQGVQRASECLQVAVRPPWADDEDEDMLDDEIPF
jgi:hypothetical protein